MELHSVPEIKPELISAQALSLNNNANWGYNSGVSASGITGNVIDNNGGVGVDVQGSQPPVLTISGNDIYQNTNFELRNDSGIAVVATNGYWGEPTTSEFNHGQVDRKSTRLNSSHLGIS